MCTFVNVLCSHCRWWWSEGIRGSGVELWKNAVPSGPPGKGQSAPTAPVCITHTHTHTHMHAHSHTHTHTHTRTAYSCLHSYMCISCSQDFCSCARAQYINHTCVHAMYMHVHIIHVSVSRSTYCIAGNFQAVKFSWIRIFTGKFFRRYGCHSHVYVISGC